MENSRKGKYSTHYCYGNQADFNSSHSSLVTHGCIVATVKLYLPDGKEAKARFLFFAMSLRITI